MPNWVKLGWVDQGHYFAFLGYRKHLMFMITKMCNLNTNLNILNKAIWEGCKNMHSGSPSTRITCLTRFLNQVFLTVSLNKSYFLNLKCQIQCFKIQKIAQNESSFQLLKVLYFFDLWKKQHKSFCLNILVYILDYLQVFRITAPLPPAFLSHEIEHNALLWSLFFDH